MNRCSVGLLKATSRLGSVLAEEAKLSCMLITHHVRGVGNLLFRCKVAEQLSRPDEAGRPSGFKVTGSGEMVPLNMVPDGGLVAFERLTNGALNGVWAGEAYFGAVVDRTGCRLGGGSFIGHAPYPSDAAVAQADLDSARVFTARQDVLHRAGCLAAASLVCLEDDEDGGARDDLTGRRHGRPSSLLSRRGWRWPPGSCGTIGTAAGERRQPTAGPVHNHRP